MTFLADLSSILCIKSGRRYLVPLLSYSSGVVMSECHKYGNNAVILRFTRNITS